MEQNTSINFLVILPPSGAVVLCRKKTLLNACRSPKRARARRLLWLRKLLLHRDQLAHLKLSASQKGLTILPLRLYIRNHVAKVELGLARGRRQYDKRKVIARRDADRAMEQAIRRRR